MGLLACLGFWWSAIYLVNTIFVFSWRFVTDCFSYYTARVFSRADVHVRSLIFSLDTIARFGGVF